MKGAIKTLRISSRKIMTLILPPGWAVVNSADDVLQMEDGLMYFAFVRDSTTRSCSHCQKYRNVEEGGTTRSDFKPKEEL